MQVTCLLAWSQAAACLTACLGIALHMFMTKACQEMIWQEHFLLVYGHPRRVAQAVEAQFDYEFVTTHICILLHNDT